MDPVAAFIYGLLIGMGITDFVWRRLSRKWADLSAAIAALDQVRGKPSNEKANLAAGPRISRRRSVATSICKFRGLQILNRTDS